MTRAPASATGAGALRCIAWLSVQPEPCLPAGQLHGKVHTLSPSLFSRHRQSGPSRLPAMWPPGQRVAGGIEVKEDLLGWLLLGIQEEIDELASIAAGS
jgi:hypothetical protein